MRSASPDHIAKLDQSWI